MDNRCSARIRVRLADDLPTIVGIDHGFSFPIAYFDRYSLPRDWPNFLLDFQKRRPAHETNTNVDFIHGGDIGDCARRMGESNWLRVTDSGRRPEYLARDCNATIKDGANIAQKSSGLSLAR